MGVFCNKKNLLFYFIIISLFALCSVQKGYCSIRAILRYTEQQKESREPVAETNSEEQQTRSRIFTNTRIGFGNNPEGITTAGNNIDDDNIIPDAEINKINIEKIIKTGVRTTENNAYTNTKSRKFTTSKEKQENDNNTDETDTNSKTNNSYYFYHQSINYYYINVSVFNINSNLVNEEIQNGIVEYSVKIDESFKKEIITDKKNIKVASTNLYDKETQNNISYLLENMTKLTNDIEEIKRRSEFLENITKTHEENNKLLIEQNRLLKEQNEMYKKQTTNSNGFGFNFYTIVGTAACITAAGVTYLVIDNLFFRDRRIKAIVNSIIDEKLQPIIANGINEIKTSINEVKNDIIRALPEIIGNTINERVIPTMNAINRAQQATINGIQNRLNRAVNILSRMQNMFNTRINTIVERFATRTEPAITSTKTTTNNMGDASSTWGWDSLSSFSSMAKKGSVTPSIVTDYNSLSDDPGAFGNFD